ncbi:carboxylating nicotinate-nucleotide diphosphorylase [Terriglobus sp.]|uniref:carboxylating nicotinate-nucleotide diphosphorylase n=1 Tax=Terriglobus sp. TaxID=1889013 RepID=UPI003B006EE5
MDWKSRKVAAVLEAALAEDKATSDVTTALTIDPDQRASATVLVRQDCVIAGLGAIGGVFDAFAALQARAGGKRGSRYEVISHPEIFDGVRVRKGQTVAVIRHSAAAILSCERVILNLLQRMSGIATLTREFVDATAGTRAQVLDTRKTMPGLRLLDKYAVCCGGGQNHRLDLQDGIMLKQSHIALAGGLQAVVERAAKHRKPGQKVEVEVRCAEDAETAVQAGADVLLFVHMTVREVALAVEQMRAEHPAVLLEVAEHLNLENVREYADTGVDFLSVGNLTRGAAAVDLSMRITADVY